MVIDFRCHGEDVKEANVVKFIISAKNTGSVQQYISEVVNSEAARLPTVILVDNLHHIASLADVFGAFLSTKPAAW